MSAEPSTSSADDVIFRSAGAGFVACLPVALGVADAHRTDSVLLSLAVGVVAVSLFRGQLG